MGFGHHHPPVLWQTHHDLRVMRREAPDAEVLEAVKDSLSANLAAVCIESLLLGILLMLSVLAVYLLVPRQRDRPGASTRLTGREYLARLLRPLFLTAICLVFLNTAAYIYHDGGAQPADFYVSLAEPTHVAQVVIELITILIGDAMIIYRLWIAWARRRVVVIFPMMTFLLVFVCVIAIIYVTIEFETLYDFKWIIESDCWIITVCTGTLCTNVYSTSMIAWRLWRGHVETRRAAGHTPGDRDSLMCAFIIFIESAVLYTAYTVFYFATVALHTGLQFFVENTYPVVTSIAFMLIIVRINFHDSKGTTSTSRDEHAVLSSFVNMAQSQAQTLTGRVDTVLETGTDANV